MIPNRIEGGAMERNEIIRRFNASEQLHALIRKKRRTQAKKALSGLIGLLAAAIVLSAAFRFSPLRWIVMCALAIFLSVPIFKTHTLFIKHVPTVGTITQIKHDYQTGVKKGTEGWGDANIYTSIRQYHNVVLVLKSPIETEPDTEVLCPMQHESIFRVGDVVLYHPDLDCPANLSNPMTCLCAHCGTAQSANNIHCYNCHTFLCNYTTMV